MIGEPKNWFMYLMMDDGGLFHLNLSEFCRGRKARKQQLVSNTRTQLPYGTQRIKLGSQVFLFGGNNRGARKSPNLDIYSFGEVAKKAPSVFLSDPDGPIPNILKCIDLEVYNSRMRSVVETIDDQVYVFSTPSNLYMMEYSNAKKKPPPISFQVFNLSTKSCKQLVFPPHIQDQLYGDSTRAKSCVSSLHTWGRWLVLNVRNSALSFSTMFDTHMERWYMFRNCNFIAVIEFSGFLIAVQFPRRVVAARLDSNGIPEWPSKVLHELDGIFHKRPDKCFMGRCGGDRIWLVHSTKASDMDYSTHVAVFEVSISQGHLSAHLKCTESYRLNVYDDLDEIYHSSRLSSAFVILQHKHREKVIPRGKKRGRCTSSSQDTSVKRASEDSDSSCSSECLSFECEHGDTTVGQLSSFVDITESWEGACDMWVCESDMELVEQWAVPLRSVEDIQEKFKKFCLGKLRTSPWSKLNEHLPKKKSIKKMLGRVTTKGFLTINFQPAVNGERSDSPSVGWGGPGGYVYQRALVEFFCSKEKLDALVDKCKAFPSLSYIAMNKEGICNSNFGEDTIVIKWGVFPGRKIIQRSDIRSEFFGLKDIQLNIWLNNWAYFYPEGDSSRKLLLEVQKSYYLVYLVDKDYICGDVFTAFAAI